MTFSYDQLLLITSVRGNTT